MENLPSGLVAAAADAQQGVEDHGQPADCGDKLRCSLENRIKGNTPTLHTSTHTRVCVRAQGNQSSNKKDNLLIVIFMKMNHLQTCLIVTALAATSLAPSLLSVTVSDHASNVPFVTPEPILVPP